MKLMLGDCLERMRDIPDGSVDLVLCDPPYGTTDCKWDSVIDFSAMWEQLSRVLSKGSSAVLFASGQFEPRVMLSNLSAYKYKLVWVKNKKGLFVHAKNRPMTAHESVLVFSDYPMGHASKLGERRMRYNPQGLSECSIRHVDNGSKFGTVAGKRPSHKKSYKQESTGYPCDVLRYDVPSDKERLHPTQKPVDLLEYFIKTYTDEGKTVLDFTMGSGSTGVACVNTCRDFIGIELDEGYFDIAKRRIHEAQRERDAKLF